MDMVYLRKAVIEDIDLLFEWANDPTVRRNSFNSAPISYENHVKWLRNVLESKDICQYILMDNGTPVGQIRLTIEDDMAEIGYSISSENRGKGYGHIILQLMAEEVHKNIPGIRRLIAKVKQENRASRRLFESAGYEMKYSCYSLDIKHEYKE